MTLDVLLVLWRELEALRQLKIDLDNQSFQNFNVHVALNDPMPEIRTALQNECSHWATDEGPNDGYAGGLERIWRQGQSDWILCANTDLKLPPETLEKFVDTASRASPETGFIMPKVFYPDGTLQSAAGLLLGPEGLCRPRGMGEEDRGQYDHIEEAPLVSGCCFLVRRDLLKDIGGFDARFFMYVEDVDLCLRAAWAGWRGHFNPDIKVVHEHGGASERYGALQLFHLERNHWWVMPQLPWSLRWPLPFYNIRRWLELFFGKKSGWHLPQNAVSIALRALFFGLVGIPRVVGRRSPRRITTAEFMKRFSDHRLSYRDFMKRP